MTCLRSPASTTSAISPSQTEVTAQKDHSRDGRTPASVYPRGRPPRGLAASARRIRKTRSTQRARAGSKGLALSFLTLVAKAPKLLLLLSADRFSSSRFLLLGFLPATATTLRLNNRTPITTINQLFSVFSSSDPCSTPGYRSPNHSRRRSPSPVSLEGCKAKERCEDPRALHQSWSNRTPAHAVAGSTSSTSWHSLGWKVWKKPAPASASATCNNRSWTTPHTSKAKPSAFSDEKPQPIAPPSHFHQREGKHARA